MLSLECCLTLAGSVLAAHRKFQKGRFVMEERKRTLSALCACLAISLGAVACGGGDETSSETDSTTTSTAETPTGSLDVVSAEWSLFCASEQSMFEGGLAAMTTTPLDYTQLEEALAPGGTPISDDAAVLLASLSDMAQMWDVLGTATVNAMVDVDLNLDDPGWVLLRGEQGVLLVNFAYETEGSPIALPVEQEAIAFNDASSALGATAQELGLDECALLTADAEQSGPDSSPASTAAAPPAPATGVGFEDQFDGRLEDGWRWSIEDPGTWSLAAAPGWLQITAVELLQNVLLRPAPDADYEVTAAVSFRPTSNFQFAGLVAAPRGGQTVTLLQLGRAYCDPLAIPGICVGDGVYFDKIEDGETVNAFVSEISTNTEVLYLRLLADGDSYSGYFSEDGEIWTLVGNQVASYIDTDIGLIAHQAYEEPAAASFDYLTVTSPPVGDKPPAATDLSGSAPAASSDSDPTPAPRGIPPTAQNVENSIGGETTFCGSADAVTERGDGLETVFMGALLLYVEPDAGMPSRWWDREFCVTGTVQPKDERGSAFITVADSQQIE